MVHGVGNALEASSWPKFLACVALPRDTPMVPGVGNALEASSWPKFLAWLPGVAFNNAPYSSSWQRQLCFSRAAWRCLQQRPPFSKLATPTCASPGLPGVAFNNAPFSQVGNANNFSSSCPACIILASMLPCFITYHQQRK
ncbi:uncharacterized protein DS421_5g151090 [Arachis hypogaea]|nr:uncharacterized protein DS421_5g151090 [Arachis hypogaea]